MRKRGTIFIPNFVPASGKRIWLPDNPRAWLSEMRDQRFMRKCLVMSIDTAGPGGDGAVISLHSGLAQRDKNGVFRFTVSLEILAKIRALLGDPRSAGSQSKIKIMASMDIVDRDPEETNDVHRVFLPRDPGGFFDALNYSVDGGVNGCLLMNIECLEDGRCIMGFIPNIGNQDMLTALHNGKGLGFILQSEDVTQMLDLLSLPCKHFNS